MTKPGDSQTKKSIHELVKEFPDETYRELEEKYEKEHKLRQEAEGELTIVKTITIDSSPEMRKAKAEIEELQNRLERLKGENNDCYNRIADLTEDAKSKDYWKDPDYKFLIEENHRLEEERNELLVVNRRLNQEAEEKLNRARKAGL